MLRARRADSDRGAALVEAALIISLLMVLAIGAGEFGFALVDWLAVSSATREGARTGSAAAQDPAADTLILAAVDQAMDGNPNAVVNEVWIFKADANGNVDDPSTTTNIYQPSGGGFVCANGCPWSPASRQNSLLTGRDHLGVRIVWQHDWITGLVPWIGSQVWVDNTIMQLEIPPP